MNVQEKTIVDQFTGEILSAEKTIIRTVRNTDEFIQVYLNDMKGLMDINSCSEFKVLMWMWKMSDFLDEKQFGNAIGISGLLFNRLKKECNIKDQTVRNTISSLAKKGLLIKDDNIRGTYYLNPKFFFKGALSDRTKCLTSVIQYKIGEQD